MQKILCQIGGGIFFTKDSVKGDGCTRYQTLPPSELKPNSPEADGDGYLNSPSVSYFS